MILEAAEPIRTIYLAGGCFWGVERFLQSLPGVKATEVGYANGRTENPSYEDVCYRNTGHAETVKVKYYAAEINLETLLDRFFQIIDPLSFNRQANDVGPQYRTGIYYTDERDLPVIEKVITRQRERYGQPLMTEFTTLKNYYVAEEYHQNYLLKNPKGYCHINEHELVKATRPVIKPELYSSPDAQAIREQLDKQQFHITMENGTEPPFHNKYYDLFQEGIYVDILSGEPLFSSVDKFVSDCGWPSFTHPIAPEVVNERYDFSHGMMRTEVRSRVADIHLGHVFEDGPRSLGSRRYCINSAALRFIPHSKMEEEGYGYLLSPS